MRKSFIKACLLLFVAVCSIAIMCTSCANEDVAQNNMNMEENLTTFTANRELATRTSMDTDGTFYWEAGDKIYVKDDNGVWQVSTNSPISKTASFRFKVPGQYINHLSYDVYYPGRQGHNDQVTISATQSQSEPNTTNHFGVAGDCGMATATRLTTSRSFKFQLDHKATYLLFLPRTENIVLHDCYLTKIEVISDNDITSTYTLDKVTGELVGTGTGNQIVLTTKGSGAYTNGFPLTNSATSAITNGAYMVIKPGVHSLKIRYWVKDVVTGTQGFVLKTLASMNFEKNKFYNVTANLNIESYDANLYYMWDAQNNYWAGHEWNSADSWQPILNNQVNSNYPKSGDALGRYYNETNNLYSRMDATTPLFKSLPNGNEIDWYARKGDPHWDNDRMWTIMGHLYTGGMWFLKKAYIPGFSTLLGSDGYDWRAVDRSTSNYVIKQTALPAEDTSKYFYLPALGYYNQGVLSGIGSNCMYWTCHAGVGGNNWAVALYISQGIIIAQHGFGRFLGARVRVFE